MIISLGLIVFLITCSTKHKKAEQNFSWLSLTIQMDSEQIQLYHKSDSIDIWKHNTLTKLIT